MNLLYLNLCRLCAGSCENSVPIFKNTGILNFAEKIKSYLHVEIKYSNDVNDEPKMCNSCYDKLINWDQYAEQVQKVQGMFSSLSNINKKDGVEDMEEKAVMDEQAVMRESLRKLHYEILSREKKKDKQRKAKKNRIAAQIQKAYNSFPDPKAYNNFSDPKSYNNFSDEDETQFTDQADPEFAKNRQKDQEGNNIKPRIKLKIKPIKEENLDETENNVCVIKQEKIDIDEDGREELEVDISLDNYDEEEDVNEDDDDKDESEFQTPGMQPLFTWECLECHAPVKNWNVLVKHCREVHGSTASVQCACGKILQSRASIMKHRMKHTIGYGYKCEYENCNKTFHRQQLLDVHSLSHMPKELQPWMCCKCSRRFHTESLLKQHEKVHLPKEEKLIHPCEVCQKKFCSKSAVSAHIRAVHFGERPFVCDQCGHSFTSKGILHEHLTIHSDVYNFHCKDCNKSFKTKYRLKIHMDTHVETRYQCPFCTLTLNTRRTLRMHLLVHKDEKAFQCTTCGKAFKRSKDLKNHYNLHTGRRPYTCPFCQRTFANGSNCRSHKRRMHPEELKLYEAALAAGQQPPVFRGEDQQLTSSQQGSVSHFLDDSNESKSDVSDVKKYSDDDDKPVSLVPYEGEPESETTRPDSVPLDLQGFKKIKEERIDEDFEGDGEECMGMNEEDGGGMDQMSFESQSMSYPVHNLYAFQSSGIPAFPGNPFFRQ